MASKKLLLLKYLLPVSLKIILSCILYSSQRIKSYEQSSDVLYPIYFGTLRWYFSLLSFVCGYSTLNLSYLIYN